MVSLPIDGRAMASRRVMIRDSSSQRSVSSRSHRCGAGLDRKAIGSLTRNTALRSRDGVPWRFISGCLSSWSRRRVGTRPPDERLPARGRDLGAGGRKRQDLACS